MRSEHLERLATDPHTLEDAWQKMPQRQRRDTRIALAAARSFITAGMSEHAQRIIEDSVDAAWDSELVALYAECAGGTVAGIERAEAWLKAHPQDAALLLTLGRLCVRQALWGKAQSYIEASLALEHHPAHPSRPLHERTGIADAACETTGSLDWQWRLRSMREGPPAHVP